MSSSVHPNPPLESKSRSPEPTASLKAGTGEGMVRVGSATPPRVLPECLDVQPIVHCIEGYLGETLPKEIDPLRDRKELWWTQRLSIKQPPPKRFHNAYRLGDPADIVGRPCWLGDADDGLVAGVCLQYISCGQEDEDTDALAIYVQTADPESLKYSRSHWTALDHGDWIYKMAVDRPMSSRPRFWVLEEDIPREDLCVPERACASLLRTIPACPVEHIGNRAFWDGHVMIPVTLQGIGDGRDCEVLLPSDGETMKLDASRLLALTPQRPDTPTAQCKSARKFDQLWISGHAVYCWGRVDGESEQMVICSLETYCPELHAAGCRFIERRRITDDELSDLVRADGTATDLHATFKGRSAAFFHWPIPSSASDSKGSWKVMERGAPRFGGTPS